MRQNSEKNMTTTDWPFHESYRLDLPPTQIKAAVERCLKKNIVDLSAPCEETHNIIQAVFNSYQAKKSRARTASSRARAAKSAEAEPLDIEVEPTEEAACVVCEVVAEPPIVAEPEAAPEPAAAAPPTKAASKAAKTRADNVAPTHPASEAPPPAPAPKRAAAAEAPAPRRRGGGLVGMVASIALP